MQKCNDFEIKKILLDILIYFDKLCKKNNLNYSLYAGTLLGAIRHQGFIPWDDDVDVIMPLPDYQKFLNIPEINTNNARYRLHDRSTETDNSEKYVFPFAKLEDEKTQISFEASHDKGGAFVDIFPITGFPESEAEISDYERKILTIRPKIPRTTIIGQGLLRKMRNKFYRKNYQKYRDYYIELVKTYPYEKSNEVGQNVWPINKPGLSGEHFSKSWMQDYTSVKFEGYNLSVITNYEKLLELKYGDWKKLPPKDQQVAHHAFQLYTQD